MERPDASGVPRETMPRVSWRRCWRIFPPWERACRWRKGFPLGAAISISAITAGGSLSGGSARFSGHVSYCEYRDFGYFVGIRFSDETPWSTSGVRSLSI